MHGTDAVGLAHLVGESSAFVMLKRKLPLLAQCEAAVLLTGETGTGKGLCARALHYLSRRAGKPFLPVNCGAIPVELFERALFGHQKGAFTSAWAAQSGLIAEVEGGTLFLDEIATLSLSAQAKLLRFLEDQTYYVLGSPRPRQADVWIIAATNVELLRKVRDGTLREDFFYRLAVMTLTLPPLRERRADIPCLVAHPEAQDTVGGIAQWWLLQKWNERLLVKVERVVSLLLSQALMLEIRRPGVPPYCQRNAQQREAITKFLQGS